MIRNSFESDRKKTRIALALAGILALAFALPVAAQDAAEDREEIVTIGTRTKGRTAVDSPVPVDVLDVADMQKTGQVEVGRMLQQMAPSFNFSSSSISDGTDALRPATLRGLGPDQTLVLVNGKRRHGSALIHVNTSVGRGTAGTDLNAIPAAAIKRIEILRDGAAAQYGSDAIAGVINIVLKDSDDAGSAAFQYGEYGDGDGETFVGSLSKGFSVGEGFVNVGVEFRDRGRSDRAGKTGACQFIGTCTPAVGGGNQTTDPREIAFDRDVFRIGDAISEHLALNANFMYPVAENAELYAFALYSTRDNLSRGFYRRANQQDRDPTFLFDGVTEVNGGDAFFPNGFLPKIITDVDDFSINGGIRGWTDGGLNWDLSAGFGMNDFAFTIANSINASQVSATGTSPTRVDAGELGTELFTVDFDVFQDFGWGVLAGGVAYRLDKYTIDAGEKSSYFDFDTDANGVSLGPLDAAAGIQVFPGFKPSNEVDEDRDSIAVYLDAEYSAVDRLLLGLAGRFEDYSDFGSTFNIKGTASFDIVQDVFKVRGSASTGFRAPSLQQQFFNNTSTQFVTDPNTGQTIVQERGTFRNDSLVAQAIGIPKLKEETSVNFSLGFHFQPLDNLGFTVDYYNIQIDDRVVLSGSIGKGLSAELDAALTAANANSAQFFLNAVDTDTQGVDVVATYDVDVMDGSLNVSAAFNWTETEIDSIKPPSVLSAIPGTTVFTSQDRSIITEWQPKTRLNLTSEYDRGPAGVTLAVNEFGKYTVEEGGGARQTFGAKWLVDLHLRYAFENGLTLKAGGLNIFNTTPDKNRIGQARGGKIVDGSGNVIVDSPGVFKFSRRSAPFGFNGSAWYTRIEYAF